MIWETGEGYWDLKEEGEIEGNDSLSIEHKE